MATGSLHDNISQEINTNVFKKYEVIKELGRGTNGVVEMIKIKDKAVGGSACKSYDKNENSDLGNLLKTIRGSKNTTIQERRKHTAYYALKTVNLKKDNPAEDKELIENEIAVLRNMDHPGVVRLHNAYYYKSSISVVMECCEGRDLYAHAPYSEQEVVRIMRELLSAVKYLHECEIIHRDLKFKNVLFARKSRNSPIKLIDFGLSIRCSDKERTSAHANRGTLYTSAPEILNHEPLTTKTDLWSVGVILYMLLSNTVPFFDKNKRKLMKKIQTADYSKIHLKNHVSEEDAMDMVASLLVVDPRKRLDATAAMDHKFLQKQNLSNEASSEFFKDVQNNFLNFRKAPAMKRIALNLIAHRSTSREVKSLREAFQVFDTNGDGFITYDELKAALKQTKCSKGTISKIFYSIDVTEDEYITYTEFLAATMEVFGQIEEERIAQAFDQLDSDNSGFLCKDEIQKVLVGTDMSCEEVIAQVDKNRDGQICYKEFLAAVRS